MVSDVGSHDVRNQLISSRQLRDTTEFVIHYGNLMSITIVICYTSRFSVIDTHDPKFETQQKALEFALESLENGLKQNPDISQEDQFWLQMRELKVIIHIHKDVFLEMVKTADYEKVDKIFATYGLAEYMIVFHYQKPLRECSLKEVMDGVVITARAGNWLDTINYTDNSDHYTLIATHSVGNIKYSNSFRIFYETLFEVYGVKTQSKISDNSLFMKIYKNLYLNSDIIGNT